MDAFIIGLYGVYLIMVGARGNSGNLVSAVRADMPGFLPWLISLAVLAALHENETTKPVAKPLLFLAILSFVLLNFGTLEKQVKQLYAAALGTAK